MKPHAEFTYSHLLRTDHSPAVLADQGYTHIYWGHDHPERYRTRCRVVARTFNGACIEFEDGRRVSVAQCVVRRAR